MAQLTSATITIDGKPIRQFSSFSLSQGIFEHHFFRLTCPAESIDGSMGAVFNQSKNLLGAVLSATIRSVTTAGQLQFRGVVTQVETERFSGASGDVVISGYSPTIVLESGPHCKTWEKKAVKNIVQDVLSHFPENLLKSKAAPTYPQTLSYYVQYKETAWRFLNRICSNYGEWLYYDGLSLIVGQPSDASTLLQYGNNLNRFAVSLQLRPPSQQVMAYDYMNHKVYTSVPSGIEDKAGLDTQGKHAYKASQTLYATQPKMWDNHFLTNQKQLDDLVNTQAAMRSSNLVRFSGSSGHPGVAVGARITVSGQNMYSQSKEDYGAYTVLSVNHYTDGQGNYSNDFIAVPASIKLPPVAPLPEPVCETQSAMVTDNHDPLGLGRIRVRFHWMKPGEKTPWLRVSSPHGGGGKGMFFIPEVGEEVIVGFEGNSAIKAYVDGTVYHGKANNTYSNGGNDVKALQTRSGNRMIMNDKDGSVFVSDKGGANTMMDGAGNITTNANANSVLNAGALAALNVGGREGEPPTSFVTMDSGGNIVIDGKASITIRVGGNSIIISEAGIVTVADKGKIESTATSGPVCIKSASADASFIGSTDTTIGGGANAFVTAGIVEINQA
jgi:type VI secretion system secreted protein VgrG